MPTQGPRFNFYQAPPGPDSSRQYSDWQNAILAQGEAFNEPLRLLLKGMIEGKLQDKRIRADKEARADERDYQKTRDAAADARFQQDFALRQGAEDRQVQREQYDRAQGNADVGLLLDMLAPKNSVEKLSPQYQQLQQLRGPEVPLSPLAQPVAPHASVIDDAIRETGRMQEQQQKEAAGRQAEDERMSFFKSDVGNLVKAGVIPEDDAPAMLAHVGNGAAGQEAYLRARDDAVSAHGATLTRAEQYKDLDSYAKAHPEDPKVQKFKSALVQLKPLLKDRTKEGAQLWERLYPAAAEGMFGITKESAEKTPPGTDLPGLSNYTINSSLKNPGAYSIGKDGEIAGLKPDAASELDLMARKALSDDPVFSNRMLSLLDLQPTDAKQMDGWMKQAQDTRAKLLREQKVNILNTLGFQDTGATAPAPDRQVNLQDALKSASDEQKTRANDIGKAKAAGWSKDEWRAYVATGAQPTGKELK